jgi:hypothetical protein
MKVTLLALSFIVNLTIISAQQNWKPGTVNLEDGSTFTGEINDLEWKNGPYAFEFRENGTVRTYGFDTVKSFEVNKYRYFSTKLQLTEGSTNVNLADEGSKSRYRTDEGFVQQLLDGERKLYRYTDRQNKTHFLIGEPDKLIVLQNHVYIDRAKIDKQNDGLIRDVEYRRVLADYLNDCPEMIIQLGTLPYQEKKLLAAFKQWNNCTNNKVAYQQPKSKFGFALTPVLGFGMTTGRWSNDGFFPIRQEITSHFGPYVGGSVQLIMPGRNQRFRINLEVIYTSFELEVTQVTGESDQVFTYSQNYIEDSGLQVLIGPQLDFYLKKRPVVVGLGFARGYFLNHYTRIKNFRESTIVPNTSRTIFETTTRNGNQETGAYLDLGIRFKSLQFSLRYQHTFDLYAMEDFNLSISRLSLMARYSI